MKEYRGADKVREFWPASIENTLIIEPGLTLMVSPLGTEGCVVFFETLGGAEDGKAFALVLPHDVGRRLEEMLRRLYEILDTELPGSSPLSQ
jgi:hypothetical protein